MATKKNPRRRRRSSARRNPSKSRRRSRTRRNPPLLSVRGMMNDAVQGVKDVAALEAGRAVTNFVSRLVPLTNDVLKLGVRVGVAFAGSRLVQMFMDRDTARMYLAGGLSTPVESVVKKLQVPLLTAAVSSDAELVLYFTKLGRAIPAGNIGMYPTPGRPVAAGLRTNGNLGMLPGRRRPGVGMYPTLGDGTGSNAALMTGASTGGGGYF